MAKWIRSDDVPPPVWSSALIAHPGRDGSLIVEEAQFNHDGTWTLARTDSQDDPIILHDVTHWMPLPAPPEETPNGTQDDRG